MDSVFNALVFIHVTAGFVGLAAFWVPIFTKKGAKNHKLFGKIFKYCAYVVLGAAILSVSYRTGDALLSGVSVADNADDFGFIFFLGYLAVVTLIGMRHGFGVLSQKQDLSQLNTPINVFFGWAAIGASAFIVAFALYYSPSNNILLFALSPLGIANGYGILKVTSGKRMEKKAWFYEHMGALMGTGIAFHTAFAVFGSVQLFNIGLEGFVAVIPWVLPALVGIPAVTIWTRYYQRKFGDLAV